MSHDPDTRELAARLETLGSPRILVVGDLILDRYVFGAVERVSPEAPIQVLAVEREEYRVGGAGNVARNLHAVGAEVELVGTVGDDATGEILRNELSTFLVDEDSILMDSSRPTIEKTRMVASAQQVLRVDREDVRPLDASVEEQALDRLGAAIDRADLIIVSDYGKGMLTDRVLRCVIDGGRRAGKRVIVDPKGRSFGKYRGASLLTPNRLEAERVTATVLEGDEALAKAGEQLRTELELEAVLITLGAAGMYLHRSPEPTLHVQAEARAVYDVTGAGDTVIALLGLSLAAGTGFRDAIRIANVAAGIVVGKVGTASVTRAEICARLREGSPFYTAKELSIDDLCERLATLRNDGRTIVFTNGCFDLVHAGHVHYLQFARNQGDCLVVGLNTDESIRELKGAGRPVQTLAERKQVLGAFEMVDYIIAFEAPTPSELIRRIRPDVLVKGEDWRDKGVVGREIVEEYGGRVVLAPLVAGQSTTGIVERILEAEGRSHERA